ncbi:MAG: stage II sporulation protein D [Erysipelotrichaceae bacterium]|nr:stage II sporulation protein D [Erysipelotrichaceae bacterium]
MKRWIQWMLVGILMLYGYRLLEEETLLEEEIPVMKPVILVSIQRKNEQIEMELEQYLVQVVGSEMPASFDLEALKAQAIASRTFVASRKYQVDDSTKTQVFQSDEQFRKKWKGNYEQYLTKIQTAVNDTKGMVMKYDGTLVRALFFSCSNGNTVPSNEYYTAKIPYLVSVTSPWDEQVNPNLIRQVEIDKQMILSKLGSKQLSIQSYYDSGYVKTVKIGDKIYSGKEVRETLGLRSSCFEVKDMGDVYLFTTYGSGHGVGMSQYGALGMAKEGYNYEQILKHYYPGVEIVTLFE